MGTYPTAEEAGIAQGEMLKQRRDGTYKPASRQTFGGYLTEWLEGLEAAVAGGSLKASTRGFYQDVVVTHLIPHLGGTVLTALTTSDLNKLYASLLKTPKADGQPRSRTTVSAVHKTARKALEDAVRAGIIGKNQATYAKAPQPDHPEMRVWDADQLSTFAASVAGDRLAALWVLAMNTGLRRSELAGLRWVDVDLDATSVTVSETRVVVSYEVVTGTPKSKRSARRIGLDPVTVAALRAHKARQAAERLAWGPGWTDCGLVFVQEDGRPYHPQRLSQAFQVAARKAGLPRIRLHDLRHSHATAGLEAGVPLLMMSRRLGHSSLSITADTYSHVLPAADQEAADQIASYVASKAQQAR